VKILVPLALLAALAAPLPAAAAVLYKSIGPNGTIMFSDVPPPADARIVEQRQIGASGYAINGASPTGFQDITQLIDSDAALARANAQVDLAEHSLAEARRGTWSPADGLKLSGRRVTRAEEERVEFYKRNVLAARQSLMDLLRERMLASR
jgi:uncharacterized protein DUF4124